MRQFVVRGYLSVSFACANGQVFVIQSASTPGHDMAQTKIRLDPSIINIEKEQRSLHTTPVTLEFRSSLSVSSMNVWKYE